MKPADTSRHPILRLVLAALILAFGLLHAALAADTDFDRALLGKIESATKGEITVSTSVPDAEAVKTIFGLPLIERGIQPVWLEVRNGGTTPLWYMPITTDETYFAPLEAVYRFHDLLDPDSGLKHAARVTALQMPLSIGAGKTVSGFVFTHLETGLKFLRFGLLDGGNEIDFEFVLPVAGPVYAAEQVDFATLYPKDALKTVDLPGLRAAIEQLPCCTTNAEASQNGDPLNLVIIGDGVDSLFPFVGRGWRLTQPLDLHSAVDTTKSFLIGSAYATSPVSPLYLFGRHQDLALEKARSNIDERNHLRLWLTPLRYQGRSVWIGQISRDIGVELTDKSWYLTTHRIGPEVDFDRDYLLQDMLQAGAVEHFGYAKGVGASTAADPRVNLTNDPYLTDGLRLVLMIGKDGDLIRDVGALEWEAMPEPAQP